MRVRKLSKASLFYSLGQYSVHILIFVSIVILARLLSSEEIGTLAVAGSVSILAMELHTIGVVQFLVRE